MKFRMLLLIATILVGACNSKTKAPETPAAEATGTKGEASTIASETGTVVKAKPVMEIQKAPKASTESSGSGTLSSESENTAKARKGWSKTAKGAVIGGVVGAGTGAVVNKKNRAVGAVVGGAVGAGAGAIIGNEMDKRDGRH